MVSSSQRRGGTEGHIYVQYSTGKRVGKETVSVVLLYPVLYEAHFLFWRDLSEDEGGPSGAGAGSGIRVTLTFFQFWFRVMMLCSGSYCRLDRLRLQEGVKQRSTLVVDQKIRDGATVAPCL